MVAERRVLLIMNVLHLTLSLTSVGLGSAFKCCFPPLMGSSILDVRFHRQRGKQHNGIHRAVRIEYLLQNPL